MKNKNGFTLIEILVAVVVMTTSIFGVMALLPTSYMNITNSGRLATMNHLAQQKMDYLRTLAFTSSELTDGSHPAVPEFPLNDGHYAVKWTVVTGQPTGGMKTITVEVGYDYWDAAGTPIPGSQVDYQKLVRHITYLHQ